MISRLMRMGFVLGAAIDLLAFILLLILDRDSPEFVVTVVAILACSLFLVLDYSAIRYLAGLETDEYE